MAKISAKIIVLSLFIIPVFISYAKIGKMVQKKQPYGLELPYGCLLYESECFTELHTSHGYLQLLRIGYL